jgi:hypothetical protein
MRRLVLAYPGLANVRELTGPAEETRAFTGQVESLRSGYEDAIRRSRERAGAGRLGAGYSTEMETKARFGLAGATAEAKRGAETGRATRGAAIQKDVLQNLIDLQTLRYMSQMRKFEMMQQGAAHAVSTATDLTTGILGGIGGMKGGGGVPATSQASTATSPGVAFGRNRMTSPHYDPYFGGPNY